MLRHQSRILAALVVSGSLLATAPCKSYAAESGPFTFPVLGRSPVLTIPLSALTPPGGSAPVAASVASPTLHGTTLVVAGGLSYQPRESFWSLGSDSLMTELTFPGAVSSFATIHLVAAFHGREIHRDDFEGPELSSAWMVSDPSAGLELRPESALNGAQGLLVPQAAATLTFPNCAALPNIEPCNGHTGGGEQGGGSVIILHPPPLRTAFETETETVIYAAGQAAAPAFDLRLRRTVTGAHEVAASGLAGVVRVFTPWIPVPEAATRVRLDAWLKDGVPGELGEPTTASGGLRLWLDDRAVAGLSGLDNAFQSFASQLVGQRPASFTPPPDFDLDGVRLYRAAGGEASATFQTTELLFADGFEGGNLGAWGGGTVGTGALTIAAEAALSGAWGLRTEIVALGSAGLIEPLPAGAALNLRFRLDPRPALLPQVESVRVLAATRSNGTGGFELQLRYRATGLQLKAVVIDDLGARHSTAWRAITSAPHTLELQWRAASGAAVPNGLLRWWLDGALAVELKGLDNDSQALETVALGAFNAPAGASGALFLDGFEVWR